ncbi:GNAT family N-acetyltransferase [Brevibacterium sp. BRM-1]|uniref:GNAT family N-acetyltransferase n=1 Tax=Brevibacterium sp. BRM-1 TaxID=2999062 RepID=UPI003FA4284D
MDPFSLRKAPGGQGESAAGIDRWREGCAADGLGAWLVSTAGEPDRIIGYPGCWGRAAGRLWNLGYRFAPSAQGRGFATEAAAEAVAQAQRLDAARPVVALVLEHNTGSRAVAERCGLSVRFRGPCRRRVNTDPVATGEF